LLEILEENPSLTKFVNLDDKAFTFTSTYYNILNEMDKIEENEKKSQNTYYNNDKNVKNDNNNPVIPNKKESSMSNVSNVLKNSTINNLPTISSQSSDTKNKKAGDATSNYNF